MPKSSAVCSSTQAGAAREAALPTVPPQLDLGVSQKQEVLRSWNTPAPRKRAQLHPQPSLPLHGQQGCAAVGADGVMPPPARFGPWPGQLCSVQRSGACLVHAGTCLRLCSLGACVQQSPFAGQGNSSPAFPSSAPQHVPCQEPLTGSGSTLEDCPFWPLFPDTLLPTWVSTGQVQSRGVNTPQFLSLHVARLWGSACDRRVAKSYRDSLIGRLFPHRVPLDLP